MALRRKADGPPPMSEAAFRKLVLGYAKLHKWVWYFTHDSRRSPGGFPDLVLVRERIVFVELKRQDGRARPNQRAWLERLRAAGAEAYLWRPEHWDEVQRVLA